MNIDQAEFQPGHGDNMDSLHRRITELEQQLAQRDCEISQLRHLSQAVSQCGSAIMVTDPEGRIERVNAEFSRVTGYRAEDIIGSTVRKLRTSLTPFATFRELWMSVMSGTIWRGDITSRRQNGEVYWASVVVSPVHDDAGQCVQIMWMLEDATRRKESETAWHTSERDSQAFLKRLKLLHAVNMELTRTEDRDTLFRRAIELGRTELGFDRLSLFLLTEDRESVTGTYGVDPAGNVRDESNFRWKLSDDMFIQDVVLEHKRLGVWENVTLYEYGEPVGSGWNIMACIWEDDLLIGWLSADNLLTEQRLASYHPELLTLFASMLGHLITRVRTEEELRANERRAHAFQDKLRALHVISIELGRINDCDTLYRRIVELGREHLGFERLAVILRSEGGEMMLGTYGVDSDGNLRDESDFSQKLTDDPFVMEAMRNNERVTVWLDKELMDVGSPVGRGWGVMASLWDGEQSIGWLATDNLLTGQPMEPYLPELLMLLGTTAGYIANRLRVAQALRESVAYNRAMLEAIPDMITHMRADGTYLMVKPGDNVPLALPADQLIGKNVMEVLPKEAAEKSVERLQRTQATGTIQSNEYWLEFDGVKQYFESRSVRYADDELLSVIRNITDQRVARAHAMAYGMEQERVKILTSFITKATHEFRTPLSIIGLNLYRAGMTDDAAKRTILLDNIKDQADNISHLLDNLVLMARLDSNDTITQDQVNLSAILSSLAKRTRARPGAQDLTVVLDVPPDLPRISGSSEKLDHALEQLLDNAVRFTPAGGRIVLKAWQSDEQVNVEISDTGLGIADEHCERVFERFYRVDEAHSTRGFGLGLPIAKRIVELHCGTLTCHSTVGEGSTFQITLPLG